MQKTRDEVQEDVLALIPAKPHGLIQLAPRVGKTKIGVQLIQREQYSGKILWVTSSVKLRDEDIPAEFVKWGAVDYYERTQVIHYSMLHKIQDIFDVVILDEYQHLTDAGAVGFFSKDIAYNQIIGLSGTHPKNWDKEDLLKRLNLKPIVTMGIEEAIENKLIADYEIKIVDVYLNNKDKNVKAGSKDKPFFQTEANAYAYRSSQVEADPYNFRKKLNRMRMIYDSPSKEIVAGKLLRSLQGRKLIFCSSIAQAERLSPDSNYHSKTNKEDLQKFLNQETDILACVNAGGTGFTYHNVDHFILVQANSDQTGETTQKFARSLLLQEGYKATVWILRLKWTQDEVWIESFLQNFDPNKITIFNSETVL